MTLGELECALYEKFPRENQAPWDNTGLLVGDPARPVGRLLVSLDITEEVVDEAKNDVRTVLHLHPALAPFKCAVLPLSKKLAPAATELYHELQKEFMVDYDDAGSIGKRYRREDEIGTPYCITVDFDTVGDEKTPADGCVTVRERDSMEQVRIPIAEVKDYIAERVKF